MRLEPTGNDAELPKSLQSALNQLTDQWQCFVKPYFNGHKPGIVLVRPNIGVLIADVVTLPKNAEIQHRSPNIAPMLRSEALSPTFSRLVSLDLATHDILDRKPRNDRSIRTGIILLNEDPDLPSRLEKAWSDQWERAVRGLDQAEAVLGYHGDASTHFFTSANNLQAAAEVERILRLLPWAAEPPAPELSESALKQLMQHLVIPDVFLRQTKPLELNKAQLELISSRTPSGRRRIQGAAGTGKSVVLAARAAELAHQGKSVSVISFNKTLWHYLKNLAVRHLKSLNNGDAHAAYRDFQRMNFMHFHGFLRECAYRTLETQLRYEDIPKYRKDASGKLLEPLTDDMVQVAFEAVMQVGPTTDAILVDEGQDWETGWVELLYRSVREGGELLVAEDLTQDLYSRASNFKGARFGVAPTRLNGPSLRLPEPVAEFASSFAGNHLDGDVDKPLTASGRLAVDVVLNVHEVDDGEDFFEETVRVVQNAHSHLRSSLSISDIYLVCQSNRPLGVELVFQLKSLGLKVQHTFDGTRDDFWENEFPIKASTAHSIKGWESRAVIAVFPNLDFVGHRRALYVAMTRTLYHPDGSYLAVVTRDKEFSRFARSCGFATPALPPLGRKPKSARTPGFDKV